MPYQKKTFRKKKFYPCKKGHRAYTRGAIYGAAAYQLTKDVAKLKNLINVEFKFENNSQSAASINSTGTLQLLNGISKGDGVSNREGNSVRWKSLECKGNVTIHSSATASVFRRVIFIDKQPNGAAPSVSDVLDTASYPGTVAPRNLKYRKRFVILDDDVVTLSQNGVQVSKLPKMYKSIDMISIYASDLGTIADIETNSLYALYISSEATNAPTLNHCARTRFIDN